MSLLSKTELAVRTLSIAAADLVYLRHILEANEGLGFVVALKGGHVLLVSSLAMENELDAFIFDMQAELSIELEMTKAHQEVFDAL